MSFHIIPLIILMVVSVIFTILAIIHYCQNENQHGYTWKNKWLFYNFCLICSSVSLISWIWYAGSQPWELLSKDEFVIKEVIYPDGSKVQMFSNNGEYFNVTAMTGKIFDPEEWVAKKAIWKTVYGYVSYNKVCERLTKDQYYFENKIKETSLMYNEVPLQIPVKEKNEKKSK